MESDSHEEMIESDSNSEVQYPPPLNGQYFKVKQCQENGQIIATCVTCEQQNAGKPEELAKSFDYRGSQ